MKPRKPRTLWLGAFVTFKGTDNQPLYKAARETCGLDVYDAKNLIKWLKKYAAWANANER